MTTDRAIRLAVLALEAERHTVAVNANLRRISVDTPATQQAGARYDELTEAIAIIEQLAARPVQTRML